MSASRTTTLWFRGWPWSWWIDQPVKPPGDCWVAMTTKAPVLPSLRLAKIPGEFRGLCLDTRIIGVAVVVFLTFYCILGSFPVTCCLPKVAQTRLISLMQYIVSIPKIRIPPTIRHYRITFISYWHSFFLQNSKGKRIWYNRVQLTSCNYKYIFDKKEK